MIKYHIRKETVEEEYIQVIHKVQITVYSCS